MKMMERNFASRLSEALQTASRLSEAFKVTVCDPLCEVDTIMRAYVQSRGRENGFVAYFRMCRRDRDT
jgi:hypothetical protein